MYTIDKEIESETLELSMEEDLLEIRSNLDTMNETVTVVESMEKNVGLYKIAIEENDVNETTLKLSYEQYLNFTSSIGYDNLVSLEDSKTYKESLNDIVISSEGIISTVWTAIKKLFGKIWDSIKKLFNKLGSFFKIQEEKLKNDKDKLNNLSDLSPFEITNTESTLNKLKKNMSMYLILGLDVTSKNDFTKYNEMVTNLGYIFHKTDIILNGGKDGTPDKVAYSKEFELIGKKSDTIFDNIKSSIKPEVNNGKVIGHYIYGFNTTSASLLTIYDKGIKELKGMEVTTLNINKSVLDKNTNTKLSKLSKDVISNMFDARDKLLSDKKNIIKKSEEIEKYLKEVLKSSSEISEGNQSDIKNLLTNNGNKLATLTMYIGASLGKHLTAYDDLTSHLLSLYKEAAKKAK